MARMSGWYNIFFCIQDIPIHEGLIEKLMQNNYRNHLAHIYIYAYDNRRRWLQRPTVPRHLFYISVKVALAKEIEMSSWYMMHIRKNIMLASTNGMNEIAMLYSVRTYQFMKSRDDVYEGRILSGIGYNLSAMGKNRLAEHYYNRAIEVFYHLRLPEDIAEVFYNRALNYIMQENYAKAEHDLLMAMKVIEKLHLNSLRVCNLSKLYGLLALVSIMQKDRFNCERYLLNCRQFLNYIIEKEKKKMKTRKSSMTMPSVMRICFYTHFLWQCLTAWMERRKRYWSVLNRQSVSCFRQREMSFSVIVYSGKRE